MDLVDLGVAQPIVAVAIIVACVGTRAITAYATDQWSGDALLLLPLSVLLMTRIAIRPVYLSLYGNGLTWKGGTVG